MLTNRYKRFKVNIKRVSQQSFQCGNIAVKVKAYFWWSVWNLRISRRMYYIEAKKVNPLEKIPWRNL